MGWPVDWEELRSGASCPLCAEGRAEETAFGVRVFPGEYVDAYVGRQAAQPGYVYAIWHRRHVTDLAELDEVELAGLWREVSVVARAMHRHYSPRKMNYEVLGNAIPHLHVHITARFADGDVAPGAPLPHQRDRDVPSARVATDVAALRALLGQA